MTKKYEHLKFDELQKVIDAGYTLEDVLVIGIAEILNQVEFAEHFEKLMKRKKQNDKN